MKIRIDTSIAYLLYFLFSFKKRSASIKLLWSIFLLCVPVSSVHCAVTTSTYYFIIQYFIYLCRSIHHHIRFDLSNFFHYSTHFSFHFVHATVIISRPLNQRWKTRIQDKKRQKSAQYYCSRLVFPFYSANDGIRLSNCMQNMCIGWRTRPFPCWRKLCRKFFACRRKSVLILLSSSLAMNTLNFTNLCFTID